MRFSSFHVFLVALIELGVAAPQLSHSAERSGSSGNGLSLAANSMASQSSLTAGITSTATDHARLACRHVLFINDNPHPLLQQVGSVLRERLQSSPLIERLDYSSVSDRGAGVTPILPDGSRAPDLFLRLSLRDLKESGWLARSLEATVTTSLGSTPWHSHNSVADETTPPLVQFHWNGRMEYKSTLKGIERPKYRSSAEEIANGFAHSISNALGKLAAEHGPVPPLPNQLYGPYRPPPDLKILRQLRAEKQVSYFGLLTHNETFWRFELPQDPLPRLEAIVRQLGEEGWKLDGTELTNTAFYSIRARQNEGRLEIFNPQEYGGPGAPPASKPVEFIVHYREVFSRAEREAALDELLRPETPVETLMQFSQSYSGPRRERFISLLEDSRVALGQLTLARARLGQKNTNGAIQALTYAKALAPTLKDPTRVESQIQAMGNEISPNKPLELAVTAETLRHLGFLEITHAPQQLSAELKTDEPLRLFSQGDDGKPRLLVLHVKRQPGNAPSASYAWHVVQTFSHGRSTSNSNFELRGQPSWTHTVSHENHMLRFQVTPGADHIRYEVNVAN